MAFVTGLLILDAPASALNNQGKEESARTDNVIAVKYIRTRQGHYPYVSAQAFRYWLRTTLESQKDLGWKSAPVFREKKIAYTDANPIEWWDDDLFGYMRAHGKKTDQKEDREARSAAMTETLADLTRVSPFRVSTLVSMGPVSITEDFGTMSRHEGDPVPHAHQFYRTYLKGLLSLDLRSAGTFTYQDRTGYKNLDEVRVAMAKKRGLEPFGEQAYRLGLEERTTRITALLSGLATLAGGAKQALHYTDVTPAIFFAAVTRGGNNPFNYLLSVDDRGNLRLSSDAFSEMLQVWGDQILSPLYLGWTQGFEDGQRDKLVAACREHSQHQAEVLHPRHAIMRLAEDLKANADSWLE